MFAQASCQCWLPPPSLKPVSHPLIMRKSLNAFTMASYQSVRSGQCYPSYPSHMRAEYHSRDFAIESCIVVDRPFSETCSSDVHIQKEMSSSNTWNSNSAPFLDMEDRRDSSWAHPNSFLSDNSVSWISASTVGSLQGMVPLTLTGDVCSCEVEWLNCCQGWT